MPTYDPTGHALLSTAAAALGGDALAAQADTAEALLGATLTECSEDQATLAVVHQVNWQVEKAGELGVKSWSRGARSASYGDADSTISPVAARIVQRFGWSTMGPIR